MNNIVGHDFQKVQLSKQNINGTLPHALLFNGAEGIGKRFFALQFAKDLLCEGDSNAESLIEVGTHPDLIFIAPDRGEKASNKDAAISIEQIRALISNSQLRPFMARKIVAIIDDAHLMTQEASNALLKTLEEPSNFLLLILVTSKPQRLLDTIVSRCQVYNFGSLKQSEIQQILTRLITSDFVNINLDDLFQIADDSLEMFGFDEFTNEKTNQIEDRNGLQKYLQLLAKQVSTISAELDILLSDEANENTALSLAQKISTAQDRSYLNIFWLLLKRKLKAKMQQDTARNELFAVGLENAIQAEYLIKERNASAQLQLSDLFIKLLA